MNNPTIPENKKYFINPINKTIPEPNQVSNSLQAVTSQHIKTVLSPDLLYLNCEKPVIAALHLSLFPVSTDNKKIEQIANKAIEDLDALTSGGVDSVIIENDFSESDYISETVTRINQNGEVIVETKKRSPYDEFLSEDQFESFYKVMQLIQSHIKVPFGFSCLLNDYKSAFKLAKKFGGTFIRLDTFVDDVERLSDGIQIRPVAKEIITYREELNAAEIEIWADIHVKHTKLLNPHKTLLQSASEAISMGASRLIITGKWTGNPPSTENIQGIKEELTKITGNQHIPILIGSGMNKDNISDYWKQCDGAIIGTAFKDNESVALTKVQEIMCAIKSSS